jgi:hypothetical protein
MVMTAQRSSTPARGVGSGRQARGADDLIPKHTAGPNRSTLFVAAGHIGKTGQAQVQVAGTQLPLLAPVRGQPDQ